MWVVWSVALAAYTVGVMHRTSFGVAGLDAAERFHAGPAALSGFVVLQLLVYAALQVPVGLLLDRFGGRVLVTVGALTMATGQLVLALATTLPLAVTARVLPVGEPAVVDRPRRQRVAARLSMNSRSNSLFSSRVITGHAFRAPAIPSSRTGVGGYCGQLRAQVLLAPVQCGAKGIP